MTTQEQQNLFEAKDKELRELMQEFNKEFERYDGKEKNIEELLQKTQTGSVKRTLTNLRTILESDEIITKGIGYNEFTKEVTFNKKPITDEFINDIRMIPDQEYAVTFTKENVIDVLQKMARDMNPYHPIKSMIEAKSWDGIERMNHLFTDYLGADNSEYTQQVARKWLTGAVARIYKPGVKFEIVPVLSGQQGKGKSTLAAKLGGDYFVDSLSSLGNSKDDYQLLIDAWIIELGELSSMRKTDTDKIKNFISATADKIRLPYAKTPSNNKRTCVFIGTTNNIQFLQDLTGNRRFFPIPVENEPKKDVFSLDEETIQQIWAEAYVAYTNNESLYVPKTLEKEAEKYRKDAAEEDLTFNDIETFLSMPVPKDWDSMDLFKKRRYFQDHLMNNKWNGNGVALNKTTASEIARVVFAKDNGLNIINVPSSIMKKINLYMQNHEDWRKQSVWIGGKTQNGYARKALP